MSTRHGIPWPVLAAALLLLAGCGSDLPEETPTDLVVNVWTQDEKGRPTPHMAVTWFHWFGLDSVRPIRSRVDADSNGLSVFSAPLTDGRVPDSIGISAGPHECSGLGPVKGTVIVPPHVTALTVRIVLPSTSPPALVAPGESCGVGFGMWSPDVFPPFWVELNIDSITSQVHGRWRLQFQETRGHEFGSFVGTYSAGVLELQLIPDPGFAICEPRYRLLASVSTGDTIQAVYLQEDGGCPIYHSRFGLYAEDRPNFP